MENKKYDKDTSLAKISALISSFYERKGREDVIEIDAEREELIEEIDDILGNTEISTRHLVVEKLQLDEEVKKSLKEKWK